MLERKIGQWMEKLARGDLEGILPDIDQYLLLNEEVLTENPKGTAAYKDQCVKEAGLGEHFDEQRYSHLMNNLNKDIPT